MATVLYVALDGVDRSTLAIGATATLRTLNQGHSTFTCVMDNKAQTFNGLYDVHDAVYIKMGGVDIIKGYMDNAAHEIAHKKDIWHHLFRVAGRDYSQDLSNLFLSRVWGSAEKADDIIDETLERVNAEITYASPATATTIGGYDCHQQYLMDLFKTVLDRANMEAYVDTAKALQAFNIGANSSGLTLTYADLVGPLRKVGDGLALRNQVFGLGEFLAESTADEITEATTGWTSNGNITAENAAPAEGTWSIRTHLNGAPAGTVWLKHDLDYALGEVAGVFHFWLWAFEVTLPAAADECDDVYLRLYEDASNYFQYDFTESDVEIGLFEYDLNIGRDYELVHFTRTGYPDWAGLNYMTFFAETTDKTDVYMEVDGIGKHNMNYGGYASDSTSRSAYRRRMELQQDTQLSSHAETQDLGDSILEKKKDKLNHVTLTVKGSSCISGGNFKLWPGYKVTLNFPLAGINSAVYRVEQAELRCFPYQNISGHGHDFTAKLKCVPETRKLDHLDYPVLAKPRSIIPHLSREAFKRRSRRQWLP